MLRVPQAGCLPLQGRHCLAERAEVPLCKRSSAHDGFDRPQDFFTNCALTLCISVSRIKIWAASLGSPLCRHSAAVLSCAQFALNCSRNHLQTQHCLGIDVLRSLFGLWFVRWAAVQRSHPKVSNTRASNCGRLTLAVILGGNCCFCTDRESDQFGKSDLVFGVICSVLLVSDFREILSLVSFTRLFQMVGMSDEQETGLSLGR